MRSPGGWRTSLPKSYPLWGSPYSATGTAEEGGSGHYFPGSMASFVDAVPPEPTFIARINLLTYNGDIEIDRAIPIAGMTAFDVDAKSEGLGLTLLWAPDWKVGNGSVLR